MDEQCLITRRNVLFCIILSWFSLKFKKLLLPKKTLGLTLSFAFLFISPFQASAEEEYRFERMWPVLQQPWYFSWPHDVAMGGDGSIYVSDVENNCIRRFTADGQFITTWGSEGSGDGELQCAEGIAVGGDGSIYVADTENNRIQKFTADGHFITAWGSEGSEDGEFDEPHDIAIAGDGSVYVADEGNHRIQKFTAEGQFITTWGSEGSGDGQFLEPHDIAIAGDGSIYVADSLNYRIQKFTADGLFVTTWGREGSGDGEFDEPEGIAISADGSVYVADTFNNRVQKFTADGLFVATWGNLGSRHGEFRVPEGIAVGGDGSVYVADTENHRIQKFTADGQLVAAWGGSGSEDGQFRFPQSIAIRDDGSVYVADTENHRIQKFTAAGLFVASWGSFGSGDGEFDWPRGIAVSDDGSAYVADTYNCRIQKFTTDGLFVTQWGGEGSGHGEFLFPEGIAVGGDGSVYVADTENHRIQKFTAAGLFVASWGSFGSGNGELRFPESIAISDDGSIYVADTENHRIQKFTAAGLFVLAWGGSGGGDGEFQFPEGIAVGGDGSIYVADTGNHRIQKFTAEGLFAATWGSLGSDSGYFSSPLGVAYGSSGEVLVCDTGNHRVQVFSIASPARRKDKAIIVAGGGPSTGSWVNSIWDATSMCANFAYRALAYQGYTKDTIHYLSADVDLDLDGNGVLDDVDADATNSNLHAAITSWAKDAENLFIYMCDHGGNETFRMGPIELLQASDLGSWMDAIQETIPGDVVLLYDACRSGSFLPFLIPSSGQRRVVVTSTSAHEEALFQSQGVNSFSYAFWGLIFSGTGFYESFTLAKDAIGATYHQTPLLDGNGNGVGNEREDQAIAREIQLGNETATAGGIPIIGSVCPPRILQGQTGTTLWAADVIDEDGISRVWAVITPPGYAPESPDVPVTDLPMLELRSVGGNRYEGTYSGFRDPGTYNVAIFAADDYGIVSLPVQTAVTQENGVQTQPIPFNVIGLTTDLPGSPLVQTPVAITFTAQGNPGALYYRYYQASGYQTQNYGNWQLLQDWTEDNDFTWFSFSGGNYILVVHVTDDPTNGNYHQAGLSIGASGTSVNAIQIIDFTSNLNYPQASGKAISLNTTATGGSGPLHYRYYYRNVSGRQWTEIRGYDTSSSATWTPAEDGFYAVVVWVTDDTSGNKYSTAGMTCTIGE